MGTCRERHLSGLVSNLMGILLLCRRMVWEALAMVAHKTLRRDDLYRQRRTCRSRYGLIASHMLNHSEWTREDRRPARHTSDHSRISDRIHLVLPH